MKTNQFDSFASFTLASNGEHTVRLGSVQLIEPEDGKSYIETVWVDAQDAEIKSRLYPGRVPALMTGCAIQSGGITAPMKLSELFKWLGQNQISIWVSYDPQYGQQVSFRRPSK